LTSQQQDPPSGGAGNYDLQKLNVFDCFQRSLTFRRIISATARGGSAGHCIKATSCDAVQTEQYQTLCGGR